jgi:hypothetical protein
MLVPGHAEVGFEALSPEIPGAFTCTVTFRVAGLLDPSLAVTVAVCEPDVPNAWLTEAPGACPPSSKTQL